MGGVSEAPVAQVQLEAGKGTPRTPLTDAVGSVQVVQAVRTDGLTVSFLLGRWEAPAHQRAGLRGQGGQRGTLDGWKCRCWMDTTH